MHRSILRPSSSVADRGGGRASRLAWRTTLKPSPLLLLALCAALQDTAAFAQGATRTAGPLPQEPPLRLSERTDSVAADLESFIPRYLRANRVPGAAIALIRGDRVVWTKGFGVANALTRRPVTPETLFEVASNGKALTAYVALRLVDQGRLSLEEPLDSYLPEPWFPSPGSGNAVTLRRVLSHTSGLSASATLSRNLLFAPGSHYYYSGIGFMYLQRVLEQVSGKPLEDLAQEVLFVPLGMTSSSFVNRADLTPRTANGHLHALVPSVVFAVLYAVSLVIVGLPGLVVLRVRTGRWRPTRRGVVGVLCVAFVLSLAPVLVLAGRIALFEFAWLFVFCALALAAAFALSLAAGGVAILRLTTRRSGRIALSVAWSVLVVIGIGALASRVANLPVPRWPAVSANAAGSVRATVADMGAFLIELAHPRLLSAATAAQLRTPQVRLSSDISWGLGPGIQHSRQGDALWQWGQHVDFQSVMIIYPEHGLGVVVCTNNDLLGADVALEIAHRALGGKIEPIRQAIHLAFNYRGGS